MNGHSKGAKTPAQWTIEEVLPETAEAEGSCLNGVGRLVRVSKSGAYVADQDWPKVGQELVVKDT